MKRIFIAATAIVLSAAAFAAGDQQPYEGLQARQIKALSQERIDGLLAGQGLSYALAAELNGLPGPRHVLDLAEQLTLNEDQQSRIEAIFAEMNASARTLGSDIVAAEARLEETFASGSATADEVARQTADTAMLEGRLRAVHLNAHLQTEPLLTNHQKHVYAAARGYSGQTGTQKSNGGHGAGHKH